MVRVISVHNFRSQDVSVVGNIVSSCFAPPYFLLLARNDHVIQIMETSTGKSGLLPNVDQSSFIMHSCYGNYLASLESSGPSNLVRIYLGWEAALNGSVSLSARIAGRVSPAISASLHNYVDMIELPTETSPYFFSVCPVSGNLAIIETSNKVSIWRCSWQREGSRQTYLDLTIFINLTLNFPPLLINICEDILAVANYEFIHMFCLKTNVGLHKDNGDKARNDIKIFPFVEAEPDGRNSFLVSVPHLKVEHDNENVEINNMLQLHLASFDNPPEKLTFLKLKPYYVNGYQRSIKRNLGSQFRKHLYGLVCFFATQQEGFLYCFKSEQKTDVVSYPLTSPLIDVALEDCVMHALTHAGLETYSIPAPIPGKVSIPENESVCLLGLKPFVNAQQVILGRDHLWLLTKASPSASDMTLYTLHLPLAKSLWNDFLVAAEPARWEAPITFNHLVAQGQLVLRASRDLMHFEISSDRSYQTSKTRKSFADENELLVQSCLILADHSLVQNKWDVAVDFYKQTKLNPSNIVARRGFLIKNNPKISSQKISKGLLYYLNDVITAENKSFLAHSGNPEDYYHAALGGIINSTIDLTQELCPEEVPKLLLSLAVVQCFASDRFLSIIEKCPGSSSLLSQALIWLQRGQNKKAQSLLERIEFSELRELILENLTLLLDRKNLSELSVLLAGYYPQILADGLLKLSKEDESFTPEALRCVLVPLTHKNRVTVQNILEKLAINEKFTAMSAEMLIMIYLDQLQSVDPINAVDSDELPSFVNSRPQFLNYIPSPDNSESNFHFRVLQKLQGLLWGPGSENRPKVLKHINDQPNLFGILSLKVICAGKKSEALSLIIKNVPIATVHFMKECGVDLAESRQVLLELDNCLKNSLSIIYDKVTKDVVQYLAETFTLKDFVDVVPESYLRLAHDINQACHIRKLITMTGSQIAVS